MDHKFLAFEVFVIISIAVISFTGINQSGVTGLYAGNYAGDLSVRADKPVYYSENYAVITARFAIGDYPFAGSAVSLSIVRPDGSVISKNLITGLDGTARYTYFLSNSPKGVYTLIASTGSSGNMALSKAIFLFS